MDRGWIKQSQLADSAQGKRLFTGGGEKKKKGGLIPGKSSGGQKRDWQLEKRRGIGIPE